MRANAATTLTSFSIDTDRGDRSAIPWISFLILLIVLLLAQHNLNAPLDTPILAAPQEGLLTRVDGGNLEKRISFLLLAAYGAIVLSRGGGTRLTLQSPASWLVLLLTVWTVASIAWTDAAWLTAKRLVVFGALCLGATALVKRLSLRSLSLWIFLTCLTFLLLGIAVEIGLGVFRPFAADQRFAGTLQPNHQGVNCGLLALAGAAAGASAAARRRALFLAGGLLGFSFLVLTQSRTAFISTSLALLTFWFLRLRAPQRAILVATLLVIVCLLLLFIDSTGPVLRTVVLLGREDAESSRVPIWKDSLAYMGQRRWTGFGFGAFWTPERIDDISAANNWGVGEAHSTYLTMLLELGLIGATLFVLMLLASLGRAVWGHRLTRDPGYALLTGVLVFSIFNGILESGGVLASFQSLVNMTAIAHLAFVQPDHQ